MIEDIVKSIKVNLYDRATSPLFVTFAISWVLWNYRLIVTLFTSMPVKEKFTYIDAVLYASPYATFGVGFCFPLLTAGVFIFVYPYPAKYVFEFWRNRQKELKEVKQKIEDETPLTIEESKQLRRQLFDIQGKHDMQQRQLSEEIVYLKEKLEESQKDTQLPNLSPKEESSESHKDISADMDFSSPGKKILDKFDVPPPFPVEEYHISPLPDEIEDDIGAAKPFDRKHKASSYIGLKVQWKGLFFSVDESHDESKYRVNITTGTGNVVCFEIDKNSNHELKHLHSKAPLWLCGEIEKIGDMSVIKLKDAQIKL
jgi:hypothetical protein